MSKAHGVLLVDKPSGWTSHDVVAKLRGILGERRIGHAGTLDPMATGLLVVAVGPCTRLLQFATAAEKTYSGTVRFGIATDSLDADGVEVMRAPVPDLTVDRVNAVAHTFLGEGSQVPPMVSALKVNGTKLYELARDGQVIERAPRPVTVHSFEVVAGEGTDWHFTVSVSAGTYVRVLAADLAERLGTVGHLTVLRRLASGTSQVSDALTLDRIAELKAAALRPASFLVNHLPAHDVDDDEVRALRHGKQVECRGGADRVVALSHGEVVAILERRDARYQPIVVLPTDS